MDWGPTSKNRVFMLRWLLDLDIIKTEAGRYDNGRKKTKKDCGLTSTHEPRRHQYEASHCRGLSDLTFDSLFIFSFACHAR